MVDRNEILCWVSRAMVGVQHVDSLLISHIRRLTHSGNTWGINLAGCVDYWQLHQLAGSLTRRFSRYPEGDPRTDGSSQRSKHAECQAGNAEMLLGGRPALLCHSKAHTHRGETGLHPGVESRVGAWRKSASRGQCLPQCERRETTFRTFSVCSEL